MKYVFEQNEVFDSLSPFVESAALNDKQIGVIR